MLEELWTASLPQVGLLLLYVLGFASGVDAIMNARTPQGAAAWFLSLALVPFLALPLYWAFGRFKFDGYIDALRDFDRRTTERLAGARDSTLSAYAVDPDAFSDPREASEMRAFEGLATLPFTRGNAVELLIDGAEMFEQVLGAIDGARDYVLAQFYEIRDDRIGGDFRDALIRAARRGVRTHLLYDDLGCIQLRDEYVDALTAAGVRVSSFSGRRGAFRRFRINFRNHRKIVVVDGERAFMGGINVTDDYLSRSEEFGKWRDTHLDLRGPIVQGVQLAFLRDWYYGCEETPRVVWEPRPAEEDLCALILASGPSDELETCGLLHAHAIESAEKRVWIATPYFVPDRIVLGTLQLALLRGVDVRVIMPRTSDSWIFRYVPYAFLEDLERAGGKVYLYEPGFMHQKVLLVDDDYAAIGTANFDNRSFRLNFELTCLVQGSEFAGSVAEMLERDLADCTRLTHADLALRPFWFRFATRVTRLFAPVL